MYELQLCSNQSLFSPKRLLVQQYCNDFISCWGDLINTLILIFSDDSEPRFLSHGSSKCNRDTHQNKHRALQQDPADQQKARETYKEENRAGKASQDARKHLPARICQGSTWIS